MRRRVVAFLMATGLLAGCGASPTSGPAGCPPAWTAAVLWSTQNGTASSLAYVADDGAVTSRPVPFLGFEAAPAGALARRGDEVLAVANGNLNRDQTHLVSIGTTDCAVSGTRLDEQVVLGLAAGGDAVYTARWLNGSARVRRHDAAGTSREAEFPAIQVNKLLLDGDALYGFATDDDDGDRPFLLVMDAATLEQRRRIPLPEDAGAVFDAVLQDGTIWFPHTGRTDGGGGEGTRLGGVRLSTGAVTALDLPHPAPFLLAAADDAIYIGHTFMNPSFRPMTQYVWVTRYTPSTGDVRSVDVGSGAGVGVVGMAVGGDTLFVLGADPNAAGAKLLSFDLPSLTRRAEVAVPGPSGPGTHYPAGLFTR